MQSQGVEFPIHLDLPTSSTYTEGIKQAQSFKQSIESTLGAENIVIDLNMVSEDDLQRVTYFAENASQQDWDLNNNLGWGPDYTDHLLTSTSPVVNLVKMPILTLDSMLVRIMRRQKQLALMSTIN